jgi:hypothetical protein
MPSFTGEPRVNWVKGKYEAYQKRKRWGYVTFLVGTVDVFFLVELVPLISADIRILAGQIGTVIFLVLFGLTAIFINRDLSDYLPEAEDRLLCFLKPGLDSLRAFETYGKEDDKKKALKNLEKVADTLEEWNPGNLKFIKSGPLGKMLSDIKNNFRGGLLPTLREETDKTKVRDIVNAVSNMESGVEQTNAVSEEGLTIWQMVLSRYPSREPSKPFWQKIPTKKFHISMALLVFAVPFTVGVVGIILLHVSLEAAYLGTISTFGVTVLILLYFLGKRKPK